MKKPYLLFLTLCFAVASAQDKTASTKNEISIILNNWHKAAAEANFDNYFSAFASDAIYIGTDLNENWNMTQFRTFSKPFFDKGKAWSFSTIERNIYLSDDLKFAYFDELLDTQMKICRGSGVLRKENNGKWKIVHYVLSMTIPNQDSNAVIKIKTPVDDLYLQSKRDK